MQSSLCTRPQYGATMSFLGRLGLVSVAAVEAPHGQVYPEEAEPVVDIGLRYAHPQVPLDVSNVSFYISHEEAGLISVAFERVDEDGDVILEDYTCPDCTDDGGCGHCALDHGASPDAVLSKALWAKINDDKLVKLPEGSIKIDSDGDLRVRLTHACKKTEAPPERHGVKFVLSPEQGMKPGRFLFGQNIHNKNVFCSLITKGNVIVDFPVPELAPQGLTDTLRYYELVKD